MADLGRASSIARGKKDEEPVWYSSSVPGVVPIPLYSGGLSGGGGAATGSVGPVVTSDFQLKAVWSGRGPGMEGKNLAGTGVEFGLISQMNWPASVPVKTQTPWCSWRKWTQVLTTQTPLLHLNLVCLTYWGARRYHSLCFVLPFVL